MILLLKTEFLQSKLFQFFMKPGCTAGVRGKRVGGVKKWQGDIFREERSKIDHDDSRNYKSIFQNL